MLTRLVCIVCLWGCQNARENASSEHAGATVELVLKMQPLWGDLTPFRRLLAEFSRKNPDVRVSTQLLPNASDLAHQVYLTALEGGASDFDVFVLDVVWVREFVRAGFVADLSDAFPAPRVREQFLAGPANVVIVDDHTYAVPWFADVGLLYYRSDLVPRAPRTYRELEQFAAQAMARDSTLLGYLWQGKQYEGLSCNVYEAIWGHGARDGEAGDLLLDTPPASEALRYLRALLTTGLSPSSVTSAGEEEARRTFQEGRAVFMRNWPYAWAQLQADGSPVAGRVGVAPLPSSSGEPGPGTLGGFHLALNAHAPAAHRKAAQRLIAHLSSLEANLVMAEHYGRSPARNDAYASRELSERMPFLASLAGILASARPRPVTPYYLLVADILQSEFSAAVSGLRSPHEALARARSLAGHLMREDP
jgi:multiple sugar transport system substrate-binding protein